MQSNQSVPKTKSKGYGLAVKFWQIFLLAIKQLKEGLNLSSKTRTLTAFRQTVFYGQFSAS